ncbi:MAG: cobyric acid synthase [Pseudomonadota bacterium]
MPSTPAIARTPAIMVQGTGSNVGKSVLCAGIARALVRRGMRVQPFKPQNMSNNAAATEDGGEIGRAQALQALACRELTSVHMNPVLLKPETDTGSQVIVQGKRLATSRARDYWRLKGELLPKVLESFEHQCGRADIVIVEGAGSPAEVNLRAGDIANMGFAEAAKLPVVLVGDIERGGVIASLAGTHLVLPDADRGRIKAFAVNKFRGDPTLFDDGVVEISERTGWPSLGVIPWFPESRLLPGEDTLDLSRPGTTKGAIKIAAFAFNRIANFDDLDPLRHDPNVTFTLVTEGDVLPTDCDLVILPGSKSTVSDLAHMRREGWDVDLLAHVRRGGRVLGLCGGYQMLGNAISDPDGIEGAPGTVNGLKLLAVETTLTPQKVTRPVSGTLAVTGEPVEGYEIHIGVTEGPDRKKPLFEIAGQPEGAISANGLVQGTYVHGLFARDACRARFLAALMDARLEAFAYEQTVDRTLDKLADHLETHLDLDALLDIAGYKAARATIPA